MDQDYVDTSIINLPLEEESRMWSRHPIGVESKWSIKYVRERSTCNGEMKVQEMIGRGRMEQGKWFYTGTILNQWPSGLLDSMDQMNTPSWHRLAVWSSIQSYPLCLVEFACALRLNVVAISILWHFQSFGSKIMPLTLPTSVTCFSNSNFSKNRCSLIGSSLKVVMYASRGLSTTFPQINLRVLKMTEMGVAIILSSIFK